VVKPNNMIGIKIIAILALIWSLMILAIFILVPFPGKRSKWDIPIVIFYICLGLVAIAVLITV
jgi:predicted membrane channel-forming protein YqfA (hemolysin III family)